MKRKIFLTFTIVAAFCASAFSQVKTEGRISFYQLYLTASTYQLKFSSLSDKTITKLLGSPDKISIKKWETTAANKVKTYYYPAGEISTEDGQLSFITLTKPGLAFTLFINKKWSSPIAVGGSIETIKHLFPVSWAKRNKNGVFVTLTNSSGADIESFLRFTFSGNTIKTVEFGIDES